MGFLNKPRDRNLKSLSKERKKQTTNAKTIEENVKKPQKLLLNFFMKTPQTPIQTQAPTQQLKQSKQTPQIHPSETNATTQLIPSLSQVQATIPIRLQETKPVPPAQNPLADWHISDLVFIVEGKRIPTHKVVLVSRCAYFAKLFRDMPPGVVTTIEIPDFSHHIFSRFVRLVYGGKKDNIVVQDVPELVRCAIFFQAPEIATVCQEVANEAMQEQQRAQFEAEAEMALAAARQNQNLQIMPQAMDESIISPFSSEVIANELFLGTENSIQDLVSDSPDDSNFGMSIWSNDPILFNNNNDSFETAEAYRIVEIF